MEERSPTPRPPKLLDQVRDRLRVKHYSILSTGLEGEFSREADLRPWNAVGNMRIIVLLPNEHTQCALTRLTRCVLQCHGRRGRLLKHQTPVYLALEIRLVDSLETVTDRGRFGG